MKSILRKMTWRNSTLDNTNQDRVETFKMWYVDARTRYEQVGKYVQQRIETFLREQQFYASKITNRTKTVDSAYQKARKYIKKGNEFVLKYNDPKKEIMDFSGVRVVVYLPSDLEIVINAVERLFKNCIRYDDSENKLDKLGQDKVGYLSIHYVIEIETDQLEYKSLNGLKCEIQIRTVLQDAWASIFHDRVYKGTIDNEKIDIKRNINLLSGSLELIDKQMDTIVSFIDKQQNGKFDIKSYQLLLDEEVNEASLMRYCNLLLNGKVERYYSVKKTIDLIREYGINTIRELSYCVNQGFVKALMEIDITLTIDKFIRYLLVIDDADKLFNCIEAPDSFYIDDKIYNLLQKYIRIDFYCEKYALKKHENN